MNKSWIKAAGIGKKTTSASYGSYQGKMSQNIGHQGATTNALPAGNRIGTKNKVRSFRAPKDVDATDNYTVDARIGKGPKAGFDPGAKRASFAPSPTSKKGSSGKPGPSRYTGIR